MSAAATLRERYADAEPAGWGLPDMSILQPGRSRPVKMPGEIFGDLWPLLGDIAKGAGAPVDYPAASLLGVCASLIGAKRRIQPYDTTPTWNPAPVLWIGAVGEPSSRKTPAIDSIVAPLKAMQTELAELHKSTLLAFQAVAERARQERKEWEKQVNTATKEAIATPPMPPAADDPDEPQRPRLIVQDATPEVLGVILAGNPNGTLHLRDELAGWLTSHDRYAVGGREFWLEAYNGGSHVIDRKNMAKPLVIPFHGVSVLGGIQPEKLAASLLDSTDDGLVARFLWVWPEQVPYSRPKAVADHARLERLYRRLLGLGWGGQVGEGKTLLLTPDAANVFDAWMREQDGADSDAAGLFKGFVGKASGHVLRLALTVEFMAWADRGGPEPTAVQAGALAAVLSFFEDYAKPTALRVFGDAALPEAERNAVAVAKYIRRSKLAMVNAGALRLEKNLTTLKTPDDVSAALDVLIEADWLRRAPRSSGPAGGPPKKDYVVNPAVLAS